MGRPPRGLMRRRTGERCAGPAGADAGSRTGEQGPAPRGLTSDALRAWAVLGTGVGPVKNLGF